MKFVTILFMTMTLLGGVAQAHSSCRATHSKNFCHVKADRTAIKVFRGKLRHQAVRANYTLKLKPMRQLSWKVGRIHKVNLWTRHMFKVVRALPTYVVVKMPSFWECISYWESTHDWAMEPPQSGGAYWGGLQMNIDFMNAYGGDMIRKYHGYANLWSKHDQEVVAERAYAVRGSEPWSTRYHCI